MYAVYEHRINGKVIVFAHDMKDVCLDWYDKADKESYSHLSVEFIGHLPLDESPNSYV